jgi:hypothetical protein
MGSRLAYTLAGGDVKVQIDNGIIMMKVAAPSGDPVELCQHKPHQLA